MTNSPPSSLSSANLRGAVDLSSLVRPPGQQGGAQGAGKPGAEQSSVVISATDATFSRVLELSNTVPVIVEFYAAGIAPSLAALVTSFGGRLVLATVDGNANPQLAQAFQVQEVPAVAAVIGGRPMQLFVGMPAEPDVRQVFDQVLTVAAQNGVTGSVPVDTAGADGEAAAEPIEEPLPAHHQEAYDAIAVGDYATAIREYQTAIAQNPRDQLAVAGLAQVSLLDRLDRIDPEAVLDAAASAPRAVVAQLAAADLEVSQGEVDAAFARLLDLFPTLDSPSKAQVRVRLVDYFEIVGTEDPRVIAARRQLTNLLY